MYGHRGTTFKPVTPKVPLSVALAGRLGESHVLYIDRGSLRHLTNIPGHGLYLDAGWYRTLLYLEFKVNGYTFRRRAVAEQTGNFAPIWLTIGGTSYQLDEA
jgi:hypothetical protein